MYLKSLFLHGFKSFADKTKLEFDPGVTAVVGPNGCGKSNVVDAIRWVLGETSAKALRGGEMADVIFNGTDKRQPVGMAEVTLTLANCEETLKVDYNEVSLTRRVFRDGKSEYRINNAVCRLKDISEMLMDTGIGRTAYSIMEQGKIDMLLSSKPEDRRSVFEEAAGITKFKVQKREALRKLDYTEANLVRVVDIVGEVKRQMGSLQRQAQKARRYQLFLRDLKTLDTHFSHRQFEEFNAERGELLTSIRSLAAEEDELHLGVEQREGEVLEARSSLQEIEIKLGEIRQHVQEQTSRIQAASNRIEFNAERTKELEVLIAQSEEDVAATEAKLAEQETELQVADDTLGSIKENISRQQAQLDEHAERNRAIQESRKEKESRLGEVRTEIQRLQGEIVSAEAEVGTLRAQVGADRSRVEQLLAERARLSEEREASAAEEGVIKGEIEAGRGALGEREEGLRLAEKACQHTENERVEARENLRQLHRRFAETKSRRDVLKQLLAEGEGLAEGTQKVLLGLDQPEFYKNNIRGVLASWIQVDKAYIPAIEGVLEQHLQAIVVSDSTVAEAIIDTLTKDRLGEVALLPENLLGREDGGQMMTVPDGSVGWALDHVRAKAAVQPLLESLLKDVLIVPDLAAALDLRGPLPEVTFVTLRGETLSPHGVIRGGLGNEEADGSVLRREQEVRELESVYTALDGDVFNAEAHLSQLDARFGQEQDDLEAARQLVQESKMAISTLEGKYSLVQRELEQSGNRLENVTWELGEVERRIEEASGRIETLDGSVKVWDQEVASFHQQRSDLEAELESISGKEEESSVLLNEIRTALAVERRAEEAIQHQKEPMANRLGELRDLIERRSKEVQAFRDKTTWAGEESERMGQEIESSENARKEFEEALAAEMARRGELTDLISELDDALSDSRRRIAKSSEQRSREEVKQEKIDIRLENLTGMVRQRYQLELETFEPDPHALLAAIAEHRKARDRQEKRRATLAAREQGEGGDANGSETSDSQVVEASGEPETEEEMVVAELDEGGPDWKFVEVVVSELRQRLEAMGPVNLDAIEEFEELEERHNFLQEQHDDLVNSKEELLRVISKINSKTKKMFADTFAQVRENFQRTFKDLFGPQARANLVLVDEDDPLESGIEIIAKPPGKKLQSISLLSGGERSMTAVALLFSIYMVKPSPFCVLDELDAPLDESNIGRFLEMLDRFIDQSQFVIVTHNKRTMARADVMYGVTMEEFGVSKPVGMKMTNERSTETNRIAAIQ